MPLGNSITMGRHGEPSGYRDDLAVLLLNDGIDFEMVGSVNDGSGFYPKHEGHSGWRADEIYDNLNYWLRLNPSDIVLLHIGTNDISQGESNDTTIVDIENILNLIHNRDQSTIILFCSLIPRFDPYENRPQRTEELNNLIYQLYLDKLNSGFDIYFVDQNQAFKNNGNWQSEYMDDYVHPNDLGYHVMAETFYSTLRSILTNEYYLISGNVLYYGNDNPINNVNVHITGSHDLETITDSNGFFELQNLPSHGNYFVYPIKEKLTRTENSIINMYDAALTLRHAVGVETLDPQNQLAADVDKDGKIYAFDAALIARYVVELPQIENDHVGEWIFLPESKQYQNLSSNKTNQEFTGILLGDVMGAWEQNGLLGKYIRPGSQLTEKNLSPELPINIPIFVAEDSLLSIEFEIEFPEDILSFEGIRTNIGNFNFNFHIKENLIKAGGYRVEEISVADTLFYLNFKVKRWTKNSDIFIKTKIQVNNEQAQYNITKLNVSQNNSISKLIVDNAYPNPFNPFTMIPFKISEEGLVNIRIYNILGQEVTELFNQYKEPGYYRVVWDGKDHTGMRVADGVYAVRIKFKDKIINKMVVKAE